MSVRVTIEAASKAEAELLAKRLPAGAQVQSWRGLGVVRVGAKTEKETNALVEAVSQGCREHGLRWARVRYGDEERVFRTNGKRTNGHRPT